MTRNTLIELVNNRVLPDEIDELGHLSVPFYEERAVTACHRLAKRLGLDLENDVELVLIATYLRNIQEQFLDAPVSVRGGILKATANRLRFYQELNNTDSGSLSAVFIHDYELRRKGTREVVPFGSTLVQTAEELLVEIPDYARPRSLDVDKDIVALSLDEVKSRKLPSTTTRTVDLEECDPSGFFVAERFSGLPYIGFNEEDHTLEWVFETADGRRLGLADLESRNILYSLPRAEDEIQVYSANVMIGPKVFQRSHWVFNVSTGELASIASTVSIPLDLDARKSVPIPEEMMVRLQEQHHPDLGVC